MRILLTNDDGVKAEGIYELAKELEKDHEVIIIAPDTEKSAQSHAITLMTPLVVKEVELEGLKSKAYSISGTPADCVRAGLDQIIDGEIDLVFSGINRGFNAGMDILYSGTVSAAIEANIQGKPSIAVSAQYLYLEDKIDFKTAAKYTREILGRLEEQIMESNLLININVPYRQDDDIKGIKVCKIGQPIYDYYFKEEADNGDKTVRLKGRREVDLEENTDRFYLSQGYVSLTPLHYDLTNFKLLKEVEEWMK